MPEVGDQVTDFYGDVGHVVEITWAGVLVAFPRQYRFSKKTYHVHVCYDVKRLKPRKGPTSWRAC